MKPKKQLPPKKRIPFSFPDALVLTLGLISLISVTQQTTVSLVATEDKSALWLSFVAIVFSLLAGLNSKFFVRHARKASKSRRVFLSYPTIEREGAKAVTEALLKAKLEIWDDSRSISPGSEWDKEIEKAISDSDVVVVLLTKSPSPKLSLEVQLAREKGRRLIPVIIESSPVPEDVSGLKSIDLRPDRRRGVETLIREVVGSDSGSPPSQRRPVN